MEQGAYKLPTSSEVINSTANGAYAGNSNDIGKEIKNLIDEIDINNPAAAARTGQNATGLRASNVTTSLVPKNIQEARNVDNMYLQEIENKLGLLNNMMTINRN